MKNVSQCHVESTLKVIGGKWKLVILWHLAQRKLRFSELEKLLPGINQKMLTSSLRDMEKDKLVTRTVYAQVPPRVEYTISDRGISLGKVLQELDKWGQANRNY